MADYMPCPKCRSLGAKRLNFTWWGGAIGPRVITHVKCQTCGEKYNGKTGKDNTAGIIIYSVVVGLLVFVIFFGIFFMMAFLR